MPIKWAKTVRYIAFQDLEFEHAFAWVDPGNGVLVRDWLPYGMPTLHPYFSKQVFFLFGTHARTGQTGPVGSGIFIARRFGANGSRDHLYAVTAKHVADVATEIRINTRDGGSRRIPVSSDQWEFEPDSDDIAVLDLTEKIISDTDDFAAFSENKFVTEEFQRVYEFNIGEEGFMLGLFTSHPGETKNIPAARFGCVSMLPSTSDPIAQGNDVKRPSFVFEMHSRPGFSGSPVFVYRTPVTNLAQIRESNWMLGTKNNLFLGLLGIHSGQFREKTHVKQAENSETDAIIEGDTLYIPSSMTVVAPAERITAILDRDKLKALRGARERGVPESLIQPEAVEDLPADENPRHKEDFNSLLDAATRGNKPTDRT